MKWMKLIWLIPTITGLTGMITIIKMNAIDGIGIGFTANSILISILMAIGLFIFALMFIIGIAGLSSKAEGTNK